MIRLAVRVPRERAEEVLAELLDLAPAGVEEVELDGERVEYAVYGPPGELPALPDLQALAAGAEVEISTREIADDWQERWKEFHRPVLIRAGPEGMPSIRVRPPWEPAQAADGDRVIELVVDPGQAFGTGAHASTRLCLALLLELVAAGGATTCRCWTSARARACSRSLRAGSASRGCSGSTTSRRASPRRLRTRL